MTRNSTFTTTRTADEKRVCLLETLERRIAGCSDQEHRLARLKRILIRCATRLRMGEAAAVIHAELTTRKIKGIR